MQFSIDGEEIGRVTYPEGGMWEHGEVSQTEKKKNPQQPQIQSYSIFFYLFEKSILFFV